MKETLFWIWLTRLNLCPDNIRKFLDSCDNKNKDLENLWSCKENKLKDFFTNGETKRILDPKYRENLISHKQYLETYGIKLVKFYDKEYPKKMRVITNAPIAFYAIGDLRILEKPQIAIVGSRECTDYGKTVAKAFAYLLSENRFIITSGLAKGIDTEAHKGCIMSKGKTIAVIGTGLDIIYPKENKNLFNEIIKNNGLVISEYALGTTPQKYNFPQRNRIISAISDGVLVIEAGERSGALITVDYALEQGKNVYAIPGSILSNTSKGTNTIIKEGAKLVNNVQDILEDFA